jgi:hypothetical protein
MPPDEISESRFLRTLVGTAALAGMTAIPAIDFAARMCRDVAGGDMRLIHWY